jgi:hypothetical protein
VAPWALASVGCDVSYVPSPIGPPGPRQFVYGTEGLPELGPGINFGTDQRQEGSLVNNDRENPLFHSENGRCLHGVCVLFGFPSDFVSIIVRYRPEGGTRPHQTELIVHKPGGPAGLAIYLFPCPTCGRKTVSPEPADSDTLTSR